MPEVYAPTAQGEMLKIIKRLDHEESRERRTAANLVNSANAALDRAEALATKRRQYEFCLNTLEGKEVGQVQLAAG